MWIYASKLLALAAYPLGLTLCLLALGWLLRLLGARRTGGVLWFLAIGLLVLCSTPHFAHWLTGTLESRFPPVAVEQSPTVRLIVTLGGNLAPPIHPRRQVELADSSDRLLHTARLYRAGKAPMILLAGGNVFPEYQERAESWYASELLQEFGVDVGAIWIDDKSRNTRENALQTKYFLDDREMAGVPVLLVTSASHMPRALAIFEAAGVNVIPSSTDISVTDSTRPPVFGWLPTAGALAMTTRAWHEYLGLWMYRYRGWI